MDGKIYVRGRGKRLQENTYTSGNSGVVYHQQILGKRHYALKKRRRSETCIRKNRNDQKTLTTLFGACLNFIANNLLLVDTFDGLPPLIGEQLFNTALDIGVFTAFDNNNLIRKIEVFLKTYGFEMFHTLVLHRKGGFLAQQLDEIVLFLPYLHSVKLSDCGIGDEHEILLELGKLQNLKYLGLDHNDFSDVGVKYLLQSQRRARKGLDTLEFLDVSQNFRCTSLSLTFISLICSLKVLLISLPQLHIERVLSSSRFSKRCVNSNQHKFDLESSCFVEERVTQWGERLLNKWLEDFEFLKKRREGCKAVDDGPMNFYKSKRCLSSGLKVEQSCNSRDYITLILCSCNPRTISGRCLKRSSEISIIESQTKKIKVDTFSDEESDLLQMYKY